MKIRKALPKDIEAIVRLFHDGRPDSFVVAPVSVPMTRGYRDAFESIDSDPNLILMVVELEDGQVVGTFQLAFLTFLAGEGRADAQIESVHVAESHRGQGIGTRMMEWAIDMARQRNCRRVQLTSDKRRNDAHEFYRKLGFSFSHEGLKLYL